MALQILSGSVSGDPQVEVYADWPLIFIFDEGLLRGADL